MLRPGSAIKRKIKPPPQAAAQRQAVSPLTLAQPAVNHSVTVGRTEGARCSPFLEKEGLFGSPHFAGL